MQNNEVLLFVTNQNTNIDEINKIIEQDDFKTILILSTHKYFEFEKNKFYKKNKMVIFHTFDDFLNDESMWECDNYALSMEPKHFDFDRFMKNLGTEKNKLVKHHISNRYNITKICCDFDLGIDPEIWNSINSIKKSKKNIQPYFIRFGKKIKNKIANILKKIEITIVENNADSFIFVTNIRRLKLNPQFIKKHYAIHGALFRLLLFSGFYKNCKIATTVHNYNQGVKSFTDKIYLFTDGYFPSNYHPAYLNLYDNSTIVSDNFIDVKWFIAHNKPIHFENIFEEKIFQHVTISNINTKCILIILNHAGDWSALINRSDTDKMVEAAEWLARQFPTIQFILRPHPTMINPSHEGIHSLKRIKEFVSKAQLSNFSISNQTLDNDLNCCDLMITEYSNAFIDGLKIGKLGVIANLTNRRNLMQDYSELGFITANNLEQLHEILKQSCSNLTLFASQQNIAVDAYNAKQRVYTQGTK